MPRKKKELEEGLYIWSAMIKNNARATVHGPFENELTVRKWVYRIFRYIRDDPLVRSSASLRLGRDFTGDWLTHDLHTLIELMRGQLRNSGYSIILD